MLSTLDPAQSAIVEAPPRALVSGGARIEIVNYQDDFYRARYSARGDCLVRVALPYFPGWMAAVDGRAAEIVPVDYALSGVFVPAGDHELTLRYRSRWIGIGSIVSGLAAAVCLTIILYSGRLPHVR
jgi:uncharacterized membrane protein YfhO